MLEALTGRCVALGSARLVEGCPKDGMRLQRQRKSLNEDLDAWLARLHCLKRRGESLVQGGSNLSEARWLVCKVWATDGLKADAGYGDREYHFRRIVELAIDAESWAPRFMFSM
jgi:hypothetical protein